MLRAIMAAAIIVLGGSGGAVAQEADQERARMHFSAATSYFDAGEYADALREFERAHALSHRAELLYNISLCHERLGDYAQAVRFLERYLAEAIEVENRPNLEIRLGHMREQLTAAETASAERAERERAERERAATSPPTSSELNVGAIASFSVAALGLIGAAIFGPLAFVEDASLADGCGATRSCSNSDLGTLRTFTITTDVSLAVALAAATLGTVLLFTGGSGSSDDAGSNETAAIHLVPFAAPGAAGLALTGEL